VFGNPARIKGWVDKQGNKLKHLIGDTWEGIDGRRYLIEKTVLKEIV
jgi:hypothetical protein